MLGFGDFDNEKILVLLDLYYLDHSEHFLRNSEGGIS